MDLHRISTPLLLKSSKTYKSDINFGYHDTDIAMSQKLRYILQSLHVTFSINPSLPHFCWGLQSAQPKLIKSCRGYGKHFVFDNVLCRYKIYPNNSHIFPCSLGVHHVLTCFKYPNTTRWTPTCPFPWMPLQAPKRCKAAARRPCKAASARSPVNVANLKDVWIV